MLSVTCGPSPPFVGPAPWYGSETIVQLALAGVVTPNRVDRRQRDSLYAHFDHHVSVIFVCVFISACHPLSTVWSGDSALHRACHNSDVNMVNLLLSRGADVTVRGHQGKTPLWWAAVRGPTSIVQALLRSPDGGYDLDLACDLLNSADNSGRSPVVALTRYYCESGADDALTRLRFLLHFDVVDPASRLVGRNAKEWADVNNRPDLALAIAQYTVLWSRWSTERRAWLAVVYLAAMDGGYG